MRTFALTTSLTPEEPHPSAMACAVIPESAADPGVASSSVAQSSTDESTQLTFDGVQSLPKVEMLGPRGAQAARAVQVLLQRLQKVDSRAVPSGELSRMKVRRSRSAVPSGKLQTPTSLSPALRTLRFRSSTCRRFRARLGVPVRQPAAPVLHHNQPTPNIK